MSRSRDRCSCCSVKHRPQIVVSVLVVGIGVVLGVAVARGQREWEAGQEVTLLEDENPVLWCCGVVGRVCGRC